MSCITVVLFVCLFVFKLGLVVLFSLLGFKLGGCYQAFFGLPPLPSCLML